VLAATGQPAQIKRAHDSKRRVDSSFIAVAVLYLCGTKGMGTKAVKSFRATPISGLASETGFSTFAALTVVLRGHSKVLWPLQRNELRFWFDKPSASTNRLTGLALLSRRLPIEAVVWVTRPRQPDAASAFKPIHGFNPTIGIVPDVTNCGT